MSTDAGPLTDRQTSGVRGYVPALAGLGVAALTLAATSGLPTAGDGDSTGPAWWPRGVCLLLVTLSGFRMLAVWRRTRTGRSAVPAAGPEESLPATRVGAYRLVGMLAAIGGYGVLWYYIDFRVSTVILFVALTFIAGGRGWKALLLFPVVATAVLYVLFGVLLRVPV